MVKSIIFSVVGAFALLIILSVAFQLFLILVEMIGRMIWFVAG